jgi:hypothetical protein
MLLRSGRHKRLLLLAYALITGVLSIATALAMPVAASAPMDYFEWIAIASIAALGSVVAICGLWTAAGVYAVVFWCFHFGLVVVLAAGIIDASDLSLWEQSWVLGPFAPDAALLALAGTLAFASASAFVHLSRGGSRAAQPEAATSETIHPYGPAGSILVFAAIAVWCAMVVSTAGTGGFFGSYFDYLDATSDFGSASAAIWIVLGCGLVLSVTGTRGWLRTATVSVFAAFSLVSLPIGLRGEILFRCMAAFVACARCGRVLSPAKSAALALALLLMIPVMREVRNTGVQGLAQMELEPRLYEALLEMGGSLHPVEKVVRWSAEGDPFQKGSSYWAPIERAAARVLPGISTPSADDDMRIMNVLVMDRVGAIGFSPVAEAYRNLGGIGVVIVLALLGAGLAALDTLRDSRLAVLAIATVYIPVLTNVRNSFVSVPAHCAAGILIVLILAAMRHVALTAVGKPYAPPSYVRSKV